MGDTEGAINLSTLAQPIISNIGGSYTGNGTANGHQLTFTLIISDYGQMKITQSGAVEVTYTITEQ